MPIAPHGLSRHSRRAQRRRSAAGTAAIAAVLCWSCSVVMAGAPRPSGAKVLRWSDAATWKQGVPQAGDDVVVPAGMTILLDIDPPSLSTVKVLGTLLFDRRNADLVCRRIEVHDGGAFLVGTESEPMHHDVTITLTGILGTSSTAEPRSFIVMPGGTLELHGAPYSHAWTQLGSTARPGDTNVHTVEQVDWPAGAQVVITSTDFDLDQAERRTLVAVPFSAGGLHLDQPLKFKHWGEIEIGPVDERAEIALLGRTIVIQGDDTSAATGIGGHMMFMSKPGKPCIIHMEWVEVTRMGWVGRLARYPVHFHHAGSVRGSYVRNTSIHDCYNRALTIHDTHDVDVIGNISCETIGHAFYLEDGVETGNRLVGNLGLLTRIPEPGMEVVPETDIFPSTFYITNNDNIVTGNVAAGSEADGFWYHVPPEDWGNLFDLEYAVAPTFSGNTAHSNARHGFYQDDRVFLEDGLFLDFTAYRNNHYGVWARTYGTATWRNMHLADNGGGIYPATEGIIHTDTIQGTIVIDAGVFVGESSNTGTPDTPAEVVFGRSLPTWWGLGPDPTHELSGVNLYDGLVLTIDTSFDGYQGAWIDGTWRPAGAITAVSYESPWCVDPRNAVMGCTFTDANPVFFRPATVGANGIANTMLLDWDGCVTGVAGSTIVANNDFLDPLGGAAYVPAFNAHVIPPEHAYAQLVLFNGDFVNPLPPWAPSQIWIRLGFNGSGGPVNHATGLFDNAESLYNAFPSNLLVGGEYEVLLPWGTALDMYIVSLRFNAPGSSAIIQLPSPAPPEGVYLYEYSLYAPLLGDIPTPASVATDLDDLRTNDEVNIWYDAVGGWLYLKPTLPESPFHLGGVSVFDGGFEFFLVMP